MEVRLVSQDDFGVWLVLEGFVTLVFCLCIPGISPSIGIPEGKGTVFAGEKTLNPNNSSGWKTRCKRTCILNEKLCCLVTVVEQYLDTSKHSLQREL